MDGQSAALDDLVDTQRHAPNRVEYRLLLRVELQLGGMMDRTSIFAGSPLHQRPEFLKLNPAGKIPVLVDGDLVLTESVAIVLYLAEKYRDKGFLPADLRQRAELNRWLLFAVTELEQPLWRISKHTALYPEERRLPGDVVLASEEFKAMAAVVAAHLERRSFVLGDDVSVADFVLAYTLDWGGEAKLLGDFPNLRAYVERMYARPRAPQRIADAFASLRS